MNLRVAGQAVGLFAVTNIDDLIVLALFFGQGGRRRTATRNIALGQYLGFAAILAVSVAAAFGATLLPERLLPYLGLLPLALGIRAAIRLWRHRHDPATAPETGPRVPAVLEVAAVTFANGGDNIGVYAPVFATSGVASLSAYVLVFLALVAGWLAASRFIATRPAVATMLARGGHLLLPAVLIGIGLLILTEGGVFAR